VEILENNLTILQCFYLTDNLGVKGSKIQHMLSEDGIKKTAKIIGDCKWIVNYKCSHNLEKIEKCYKDNVKNLSFYNILESNDFHWAKTCLKLLEEVKTEYVFYLTEDRLFKNTKKEDFFMTFKEIFESNVSYCPLGKLYKYIPKTKEKIGDIVEEKEHIMTYAAKDEFLIRGDCCISIDSIFKTEILKECLNYVINEKTIHSGYTWNLPHTLEMSSPNDPDDVFGNWFSKRKPEMIHAIPKINLIQSDTDPGGKRLL
tara:strand:- start:253 stop:1026 length:774 start_codon:yes stop_codon:yes gene_type:complete